MLTGHFRGCVNSSGLAFHTDGFTTNVKLIQSTRYQILQQVICRLLCVLFTNIQKRCVVILCPRVFNLNLQKKKPLTLSGGSVAEWLERSFPSPPSPFVSFVFCLYLFIYLFTIIISIIIIIIINHHHYHYHCHYRYH